jgi:hypothetical protein
MGSKKFRNRPGEVLWERPPLARNQGRAGHNPRKTKIEEAQNELAQKALTNSQQIDMRKVQVWLGECPMCGEAGCAIIVQANMPYAYIQADQRLGIAGVVTYLVCKTKRAYASLFKQRDENRYLLSFQRVDYDNPRMNYTQRGGVMSIISPFELYNGMAHVGVGASGQAYSISDRVYHHYFGARTNPESIVPAIQGMAGFEAMKVAWRKYSFAMEMEPIWGVGRGGDPEGDAYAPECFLFEGEVHEGSREDLLDLIELKLDQNARPIWDQVLTSFDASYKKANLPHTFMQGVELFRTLLYTPRDFKIECDTDVIGRLGDFHHEEWHFFRKLLGLGYTPAELNDAGVLQASYYQAAQYRSKAEQNYEILKRYSRSDVYNRITILDETTS